MRQGNNTVAVPYSSFKHFALPIILLTLLPLGTLAQTNTDPTAPLPATTIQPNTIQPNTIQPNALEPSPLNVIESDRYADLNSEITNTLQTLFQQSTSSERLAQSATALLIFPNIIKAAIGLGGEYGKGVLVIDNEIVDHYSVKGLSLGIQFGVHSKSLVVLFLEPEELNYFRVHSGWKMGIDGALTLAALGIAGEMDSLTARKSSVGYVFNNRGLIYDLSLKGGKFSKLPKSDDNRPIAANELN